MGEAYESQGNHDLAISEYRKVLALEPGRTGIHFRLGRALLARLQQTNARPEDSAEALKEFEQELQLDVALPIPDLKAIVKERLR